MQPLCGRGGMSCIWAPPNTSILQGSLILNLMSLYLCLYHTLTWRVSCRGQCTLRHQAAVSMATWLIHFHRCLGSLISRWLSQGETCSFFILFYLNTAVFFNIAQHYSKVPKLFWKRIWYDLQDGDFHSSKRGYSITIYYRKYRKNYKMQSYFTQKIGLPIRHQREIA